jgi:signal transduction histidine kinase
LSLVAVQGQALLQIRYFSEPEFRLTGTRWLAEATATAANEVFALPPAQRSRYLASRVDAAILRIGWQSGSTPFDDHGASSPIAARLHATIAQLLGDKVRHIAISASAVSYRPPIKELKLIVSPDSVLATLGSLPVSQNEPDVLIPAGIKIAVQGADDSWLTVEPIGTGDSALSWTLPYLPLLIGGLIIALISMITARYLMEPLNNLVVVANRVGTSRELVPVPKQRILEFAAIADAFEEMQRRLLRFVEDRTHMLAAISHDLRSSLTRLRLTTENVQSENERTALVREIEDMEAMVDSTIAFASGEARALPDQRVDLAAILISIVDEASDAGHACYYSGPDHASILASPVALKRAFRNLMDNAVKYGHEAHVVLTVDSERVSVTISDKGIGISPDRLDEAFAPFRRLDPARTDSGAGLGLTIARDVVQSHGGTIHLSNIVGSGLRVRVDLPLTGLNKGLE